MGRTESLRIWFPVWPGWQYTCWVKDWLDPDTLHIRSLLLVKMLLRLVMVASIPQACGEHGLMFAGGISGSHWLHRMDGSCSEFDQSRSLEQREEHG